MPVRLTVLVVDLGTKTAKRLTLERETALFIGGRGIATYLFWRFGGHRLEPAEAPLIMASGPLTGTGVPMSSRAAAVFRSPLTGILGASNVGGRLGPAMRYSGVDALVIVGRSERPSYLLIQDGGAEVRDAADLWGKDAIETEEILTREHGRRAAVAAIGPAGENLVKFASINHDLWRQFGRTGGGAVMGYKRLKAIVFVPDKRDVYVAHRERLEEFLRDFVPRFIGDKSVKSLFEAGTLRLVELGNVLGFFPSYYWGQTSADGWERLAWPTLRSYLLRPAACLHCPAACHRLVRSGKYGVSVDLDYETVFALGGLVGCFDPDEVIKLNDLADRLGMDTISLGNVVAFAVEASRLGKLPPLEWGCDTAERLAVDIAYRRGLGDLLAEGVAAAAAKIGAREIAVHVRGLEPAGYDPRALKGMALGYAIGYRGADHLATMAYAIDYAGMAGGPQSLGDEKIHAVAHMEEVAAIMDSLVLCKFGRGVYDLYPGGRGLETIARLLSDVTGDGWTAGLVRESALRIINLTRALNVMMGDPGDGLPERWYKPVKFGDRILQLNREEVEDALRKYYELRGWDERGLPRPAALSELGLGEVAEELRRLSTPSKE